MICTSSVYRTFTWRSLGRSQAFQSEREFFVFSVLDWRANPCQCRHFDLDELVFPFTLHGVAPHAPAMPEAPADAITGTVEKQVKTTSHMDHAQPSGDFSDQIYRTVDPLFGVVWNAPHDIVFCPNHNNLSMLTRVRSRSP